MRDDFDPFDPFRMLKRFEKYFSGLDKDLDSFDKLKSNVREPLVDISETDKEVKVIVELPGLDKKDIDLRVKDNSLIIKATINKTTNKKEEDVIYQERSYQQYYRTIPLPEYADTKKIDAKYNNGILEITMPKKTKKETGKIEIK